MDGPRLELPPPHDPRVRLRWLGTAGFEIEAEGHVLLVDPYVTRASLRSVLLAPLVSDAAAAARHVPRADAIVVGHTHFDHVLDVPAIALRTGASVFGSRSATVLCRAAGVPPDRVRDVERSPGAPAVEAEVGPFHLRFVPSAHSPILFGRVPLPGDIADCDTVPLRAERYRCGAVFALEIRVAGRTLVHLGSAQTVEVPGRARDVDLLLLCTAGWRATRDLPERVVRAYEPRAVLLSHWDDFFRPLERGVRPLPGVGIGALADRITRSSRDARAGIVEPLRDLWV